MIIYEKDIEALSYYYYHSTDNIMSGISTYIKSGTNVTTEYSLVCFKPLDVCKADASFNANIYKKDDTVNFKITESGYPSDNKIQNLANAELRLGFAGWDLLLKAKVNLELCDIGFTSYK